MCLDYNLQYRPVDTDRVRREIQSAQTVIELLLLMAAEKEAEKPARSGNFETTFTVDGKERKVERTPDGRFAATKKAVGDAAAAVGKAIGDTTKGLLETDADKIRQQGAAAFDTGNWEDLDYFGKKQIKKHPELSPKLEDIAANLQLEITAYALGDQQAEKNIRDYFNEMADVIADSMEGDAGMIDKVKKGIKELPQNIKKTVSDTAKSLQENSSKAIADAEAAFVMADKTTKEAIGNAQKSALDTLEKSKKGILDKVGATGKAASDAFSSVLKAASSAGDGIKKTIDAAKEKGKEIMASVDPKMAENVGKAISAVLSEIIIAGISAAAIGAVIAGGIAGVQLARLMVLNAGLKSNALFPIIGFIVGADIANLSFDVLTKLMGLDDVLGKAIVDVVNKHISSSKQMLDPGLDYFSYILGYK